MSIDLVNGNKKGIGYCQLPIGPKGEGLSFHKKGQELL